MFPKFNKKVLMSGAEYFNDKLAINALMDPGVKVDKLKAVSEHDKLRRTLEDIGVEVVKVDAPESLQDGVYTANWSLIRNSVALMSRLPNERAPEEIYALKYLKDLGISTHILPPEIKRFSGQGDALPCGDIVFTQSPYRTSHEAHPYLKTILGFQTVIALRTKPSRYFKFGPKKLNRLTGWPDSPTYDLDLAVAILKWPSDQQNGLIAWCPEVFTRTSRKIMQNLDIVDKIEVSRAEALDKYALNLLSTGETVVMNAGASNFQSAIESHGLKTVALSLPELRKGGGSIRCVTLTLEN